MIPNWLRSPWHWMHSLWVSAWTLQTMVDRQAINSPWKSWLRSFAWWFAAFAAFLPFMAMVSLLLSSIPAVNYFFSNLAGLLLFFWPLAFVSALLFIGVIKGFLTETPLPRATSELDKP